jgi:hypothetical protein
MAGTLNQILLMEETEHRFWIIENNFKWRKILTFIECAPQLMCGPAEYASQ